MSRSLLWIAALAAVSCAPKPPVQSVGPSGSGWVLYNQSFHYSAYSVSSSTYDVGDVSITTTTVMTAQDAVLNQGSFAESAEAPTCEGYGWIQECPLFGAAP